MRFLFAMLILLITAACENNSGETKKDILGEWDSKGTVDGQPFTVLVRFKPNGVVDVMGNGKLIISQQYQVKGDSIIFSGDPSCDPGHDGIYRVTYQEDSVRFNKISDTCQQRIMNTDNAAMAKVKKN